MPLEDGKLYNIKATGKCIDYYDGKNMVLLDCEVREVLSDGTLGPDINLEPEGINPKDDWFDTPENEVE